MTASAAENSSTLTPTANGAQQHQQNPLSQNSSVQPHASAVDSLTCQWNACGERCSTPEQLYDHVCERHIGRKSTNNLCLTCQWGTCRTTTVKRDHITSHIRVHVPLKPHKCDFCQKAFKRPQDLKKHVKTHADDSVLVRSPEPSQRMNEAFQAQHNARGLQDLAANPSYHSGSDYNLGGAAATFNHHPHSGNPSFYNGGHPNPAASAYGQVYYAVAPNGNQTFDSGIDYNFRKRGFEDINDFFGDVKRNRMSTSYNDVSGRLTRMSGIAPYLPGNSGYGGGSVESFSTGGGSLMPSSYEGGGSNSSGAGVATQQQFSLPQPIPHMANARTKNDLTQIDAFLQDTQANIYEHSIQAAAAGVQHSGVDAILNFRSGDSQPAMQHHTCAAAGGGQAMTAHALAHLANSHAATGATTHLSPASAHSLDTPALTPSSSITSTSWGGQSHSPESGHRSSSASVSTVNSATPPHPGINVSHATVTSAALPTTSASLYPVLPSVPAMSDLGVTNGASYPVRSAPASGLAPAFEDGNRRYSGGRLQQARPSSAFSSSPHAFNPSLHVDANSSLDPGNEGSDGHRGIRSPSITSEDSAADKEQEMWVESIRVVEALRGYIQQRLELGQYENAEEMGSDGHDMAGMEREWLMRQEGEVLYPTLAVA